MQKHLSTLVCDRQAALPDSLNWDLICLREPQLRRIELDAKAYGSQDPGNYRYYRWFKQRIQRYVGIYARRPELRTHEAFDLAIVRLCDALEC